MIAERGGGTSLGSNEESGWRKLRRAVGHVVALLRALSVLELVEVARVLLEPRQRRLRRFERLQPSDRGRLVFVCYGNIMRSAFATAVARERLRNATAPRLLSPSDVEQRVIGVGTNAVDGREAQSEAIIAASQLGVSLDSHRATSLAHLSVSTDDVFICMDWENVAVVRRTVGVDSARVFLIGDLTGTTSQSRVVRDPYGRGVESSVAAFERIARCVPTWLALFAPGRAGGHGMPLG